MKPSQYYKITITFIVECSLVSKIKSSPLYREDSSNFLLHLNSL